ncbi:hypothetical protein [Lysinibacillus sp. C5.1]|uniref:hypothetical protein n=1 Tax=Lysinibacillus sp. C5.1 TaxID=2796169 RepID=UPI00308216BC
MLICEGALYTDRHSVGPFKVYLALEDAEKVDDIVTVVDLVSDYKVHLTSETVVAFEGKLDREMRNVAKGYKNTK